MRCKRKVCLLLTLLFVCYTCPAALDLEHSFIDKELSNIKYSSLSYENKEEFAVTQQQIDEASNWGNDALNYKKKSPGKAFLLSLAIPGLGQYYYGSKIKSLIFLGAEAASWGLYLKFDGDGNTLTDEYEIYNRANWSRDDYKSYVYNVWGDSSDVGINDLTHHLPSTNTQQYYEMTGKYNQFLWGWDDASLNGINLQGYIDGNDLQRITDDSSTIPHSAHRFIYEDMRNNANNKLDQAKRMSYVAMFNHLVSAFEALITTKKHNDEIKKAKQEFSKIQIRATLKSFHTKYDTPYIKLTYKL